MVGTNFNFHLLICQTSRYKIWTLPLHVVPTKCISKISIQFCTCRVKLHSRVMSFFHNLSLHFRIVKYTDDFFSNYKIWFATLFHLCWSSLIEDHDFEVHLFHHNVDCTKSWAKTLPSPCMMSSLSSHFRSSTQVIK